MDLVLVGAGGHCRSVIDVVLEERRHNLLGFIDRDLHRKELYGFPFLGTDEAIGNFIQKGTSFLVTIGKLTHEDGAREKALSLLEKLGAQFATVISPRAHVSKFAEVGEGSVVLHGAIVNAGAKIGKHCILNSSSLVEHDAYLGNGSHLSTGAIMNGESSVAAGSFLGSGSVVAHCVKCEPAISLGALSFLNENVFDSGLYLGSPAKRRGERYE